MLFYCCHDADAADADMPIFSLLSLLLRSGAILLASYYAIIIMIAIDYAFSYCFSYTTLLIHHAYAIII